MKSASTEKRALAFVGRSIPLAAFKMSAMAEARGKEGCSYKPLPKEFRRDGFTYRQIARKDHVAIYEQTWDGCPNPVVCFEVVRVRRREGFEIAGRFVEAAEIYPHSEDWGSDGWTIEDSDASFRKLRAIASKR